MNTISIILLIAGIASIGMAVFGKIRPDIVWKSKYSWSVNVPEYQRHKFGFIVLLMLGVMFLMMAAAISVPQWHDISHALVYTIALGMTVVLLFPLWKYILSHIEGFRIIGLVLTIIAALALIALCVYYWHLTLN